MSERQCITCAHPIVAQSRYAAAKAAGMDVRPHEGRGLCRPCYTHARNHGWREQVPQVRSGVTGLRGYSTHARTEPAAAPWTDQERAAALTCAEQAPTADLRHVLDVLGLATPARARVSA